MALIYDDSVRSGGNPVDYYKLNAVNGYLRHYENKLYLAFMAKNGDRNERWQAEKELLVCERKLKWWENHPNFVAAEVQRGVEKLNKGWRQAA